MNDENNKNRLEINHNFQFNCSPGVTCFTECCQDVTIVLTPYDIIRMKKALNITSDEFIDKYTIILPKNDRLIPMVVLKMDEESKKCQLVSDKGCTVYENRPWPCRMFPLNLNDDGTFSVITDTSRCKGLEEKDQKKITDWLIGQGVPVYDEINELLTEITIPLNVEKPDIDNDKVYQMIFMCLYNIDKFKDFVFKSSFLKKFSIHEKRIEKVKNDDLELLKLAFDWIKFGILGEKTLALNKNEVG